METKEEQRIIVCNVCVNNTSLGLCLPIFYLAYDAARFCGAAACFAQPRQRVVVNVRTVVFNVVAQVWKGKY